MTQEIPTEDVRLGPQYHPTRLWTDPVAVKWVEHYRRKLRAGEVLDPIVVDPRLFIIDGHHRWYACKLEKRSTIRAIISSTGRPPK